MNVPSSYDRETDRGMGPDLPWQHSDGPDLLEARMLEGW